MRIGHRVFISISASAALACAVVTLILMYQIDRARLAMEPDAVLEFDFVLQLDHNFDTFAYALLDYRLATLAHTAGAGPLPLRDEYVRRYDDLYSALIGIDRRWAGSLLIEENARTTLEAMNAFVIDTEARIAPEIALSPQEIAALTTEARMLSKAVYDIGLLMYLQNSRAHDALAARMARLTTLFWFFGISFVLAGLTLYLLLTRALRRAARLAAEAGSAQRQLEHALEELTSGDIQRKAQNRFLAAATHDLRQPLQALQYYLKALETHVPGERGREILDNVGRSTDAAQQLLTSLLDISKLDAGVLEAKHEPLELASLLERLRRAYRPEADDRGLDLVIDDSPLWLHTDGTLLERVLRNLLGNALAYTRSGRVALRVCEDGGLARIDVVDTGIGIPENELEAVFNEYYQVEDAAQRDDVGGMGLGLSIVRRLTRLLDIPVQVDSTVGRGTRFTLLIEIEDAISTRRVRVSERRAAVDVELHRLAILVIDDEPSVRQGMATMLGQVGCDVMAAGDADQALALLVEFGKVPDLILADYRLQHGRTGVEAIELVREEVNEEVPAILVTGDTAAARLREATASGYRLLHKPISADDLFEAIGRTTRKAS